jgi:3-oxoacyl-[acyl-carrier protein] reductase
MNISLEGKVAVVTGAGRGIGQAIALALAQAGADVACVSRTEKNSQETADRVSALGRKAKAYAVDVADSGGVERTAQAILEEFGKVDILVNNAGINKDGLIMRMPDDDWDAVLNVNLKGAFFWTKALSRHFIKQRGGKIINISSVIGLIGNAGQANYAASKAGLIGFTKSIAREFASRNIHCNAITPGFIETDMTGALNEEQRAAILKQVPLSRFGKPENISDLAVFLASNRADYITGQVLTVDGGMVM